MPPSPSCLLFSRRSAARILSQTAAALLLSTAVHGATLTLSSTNRQTITGWGMFPSYAHSNWGAVDESVSNRYIARDKIFELAANYIRLELASNTYNTASPNNLDPGAMTQLVNQIKMAQALGAPNWIVTVWSPPAAFKNPQFTSGEVNGVVSYFNPAYTSQFCQYYVSALSYLQQNGCGTPAMISLQNEPNQTVSYDGCSYQTSADYLNILSPMRTALNNAGLTGVHIGGDEPGQPGNPSFFSSGSNYWSNIVNYPVDDAIVHTYGGAGWDHYQFSIAPKTHWVTEWCDISGANQITASVNAATHIARDLVNDGTQKWFWWNCYDPTDTPGSADLVYGSNPVLPQTTLAFHVLKRLFREITPDGSFSVRSFTSNDTDFNAGLGSDYSVPVNVIGFVNSSGKTVVMIANTASTTKTVTLSGLGVSSLELFQTSSSTSASGEMNDLGPVSVSGGNSASFSIAPNTVQILSSAPSILPMQYEAEALTVPTYSGPDYRVISDTTNFSQGNAVILDATAAGNSITFTVPNVAVGKYDVRVGIKQANTRGIIQLAIGRADNFSGTESSVGAPIDEYVSAAQAFSEVDLGTWQPGTTSDKWFQFKVTGKNASSTGYSACIDYILLRPQ